MRAHLTRPGVVMAAAAIGLCTSRDSGLTWQVEQEGLHASHCSTVAFAGDDVLVSASVDHFAEQSAVYRRRVDGHGPLVAIAGGLPAWIDGIVDTGCIATRARVYTEPPPWGPGLPSPPAIPLSPAKTSSAH